MTEEELYTIAGKAEERCREMFERTDAVALFNTKKVLDAFKKHRVSDSCFAGTTGYGYDDLGRETIDAVWADVFGAEKALVRLDFVNGTHAITAAVFALVNPGETMLSATGEPYDTFNTVIGKEQGEYGTFRYYGIAHKVVGLKYDGTPDIPEIIKAIREDRNIRTVLIQRSPGYSGRRAFSVSQIGEIIAAVRGEDPSIRIFVDNCYGEFTEKTEPTQVGADLIAGSLIKNPGGGLAPRGGYICGKEEFVEKAACRLTVPGIGGECGATLGNNRMLLQGLFMAPHTTAQALKSMIFLQRHPERLSDRRLCLSRALADAWLRLRRGHGRGYLYPGRHRGAQRGRADERALQRISSGRTHIRIRKALPSGGSQEHDELNLWTICLI